MDKLSFINDLGLKSLNSKITVNVVINKGNNSYIEKSINTSKCKLIHAINEKTRYGFDNMINHLDSKNSLKSIAYRAFVSYNKNQAIMQKGCVAIGVVNC